MNRKTIFATGLVVLGVVILLFIAMMIRPSMMKPADTKAVEVQQVEVGQSVSVVAQVIEIDGDTLTIEVLEGNGYDVFDKRTGTFFKMEKSADTEIVMGKLADVFIGAIAQFDGVKLDADKISLQKVVILTGYVTGPSTP
jgi:hypothetical protein